MIADPIKLSRRDRAALVLALCELRGSAVSYGSAVEALKHHDGGDWPPYLPPVLADAEAEMDDAAPGPVSGEPWRRAHWRRRDLLRARLALFLRAVLRADAGDYGLRERLLCDVCDRSVSCHEDCCMCGAADYVGCPCEPRVRMRTLRITPLWASAPEHRP